MRRVVVGLVVGVAVAGSAAQAQSPCPAASPAVAFGPGTHIVGSEIAPGTYRAPVPDGAYCSWYRLSGFGGTPDDIIAFDAGTAQMIVTIEATDMGFKAGSDCGDWTLVD